MIIPCPRCRRKNRLPDTLRPNGEYRCSRCLTLLLGVTSEDRPAAAPKPRTPVPPPTTRRSGPRLSDAALQPGLAALGARWRAVRKPPPALALLHLAYLLTLLVLAISNALGPERWWLGSLNLYLPQWVWALPGAVILPLTVWLARRWAWVPLLALAWVLGPVMGLCGRWGLPAPPDARPAGTGGGAHLRVMTYNIKWTSRDGGAGAVRDIAAFRPDLIQMQDSGGVMLGMVGKALAGWNVRTSGQYLVATHFPLPPLQSLDISYAGANHHCVRYTLQVGGRAVTVYDVHLLSPRGGLVAVRGGLVEGMAGNANQRLFEAERLEGYAASEPGPTLVTGDLNAPMQSLVCRRLLASGLRDAFAEGGFGYGYTYGAYTRVGQPYVRIDHILASREWGFGGCWVGNRVGSDHCPVIADLTLPPSR